MTLMSFYGRVSSDGTIVCGGAGRNCKIILSLDAADYRTASHDDELAQLTEDYNRLMAPYLQPRGDGRVLRMLTTPDGGEIFVWAIPVEKRRSAAELDRRFGPELKDPDQIRRALGLTK